MIDRRLHPRSVFFAPARAQLRVTVDAEIESWLGTQVDVISSTARVSGDGLLVQLTSGDNQVTCWSATVMRCQAIVGRTPLRYRVSLSLAPVPSTCLP